MSTNQPPQTADAVNAGFARSERLKKEWNTLKREMVAVDPSSHDAAERRSAIHTRMDEVMNDMADVLTQTRRLVPTPDIDAATDDLTPPLPSNVQYSARRLHVINRTYDSSDDSDGEPPRLMRLTGSDVDIDELRQDMMSNVSPDAIVTVEGKSLRAGLGGITKGIKDKLRRQDSTPEDDDPAAFLSPKGKPLSVDDREDLALEQSRLERESRRLKRKPERNPLDDSRLEDIANRLSRISSTLADAAEVSERCCTDPPLPSDTNASPHRKGLFATKPPKPEKSPHNFPFSPVTDDDDDLTFDAEDEDSPQSFRGAKNAVSKRKKGWMALEAGVASFRALGRSVRNSAAAATRPELKPESPHPSPQSKVKSAQRNSQAANVFAETTDRLHNRGDRLNTTADGAEQMASDADDMFAAARALRQRNQKGGFFS